jgi:hypothetical protein
MALSFLYISGVAAGCRGESFTEVPGAGTRPVVTFNVGDTYVYDRWDLDKYGYQIGASKKPDIWRVARTGVQIYGASNVTVVIDSLDQQHVDTLFFYFGADGSVAQYGFLAGLVLSMGGRTITPGWDVLLSGEGSPSSGWVVGVADASGTDVVYGNLYPAQDYFSVLINGKPTIYPAYRVQLSGQTVQYVFWIAGNPASFPWFREESTGLGDGFEAALRAAAVTAR